MRYPEIKKVLVIGSGPIIIGQAAEFDYAGTQACRSLKEEGLEVVLLNSNPATIMTDRDIADKIYIEPLTISSLKKIIEAERPDSVLPTLGGQNALNLAMELEESGFLDEYNVKMLGTSSESIKKAEDRQSFKDTMEKLNEPCADSIVVETVEDAIVFANKIGYPVVIRPAYTLGGTGGGIAYDDTQLHDIASGGIRLSRVNQVLIERYIGGWKEIEFEVMRDRAGNAITICSMENIDPVGIHTGDSMVVAPAQTLSEKEYGMLRSSALQIIEELKIEGGCNIQYALHPTSMEYCVIEVNPRVSRSSALASKATGYPIAKVASKVALGYTLDEIQNAITKTTFACFEPTIDYIVVKIPKWPFDKFVTAKRTLGTQMKATGEVMSLSSSFEGALLKAIRSLELNISLLKLAKHEKLTKEQLENLLPIVDDERIFVIAEAIRRGTTLETIYDITKIDMWFLTGIKNISDMEKSLTGEINAEKLKKAKVMGFTDKDIAKLSGKSEEDIINLRKQNGIIPAYKMVDTCSAEFDAQTPYFYSVYNAENEVDTKSDKQKVLVLGSGPIRIGQGIEFDYCSVHCVWALKQCGYETIIINNNPETVSTDFDIADKLYFEPLVPEDVRNVVELEKPIGAIVQFGGQTAIKLTQALKDMGVPILGTAAEDVDAAEDRELFDAILEKCNIPRPAGKTIFTADEALESARDLGYPVLVRPSYVLGGQGMQICFTDDDVIHYMEIINRTVQEHPILVDKYMMGKEVEVDAICDGENILIPGIMEHLERAGVHSGDSIAVYPTQDVTKEQIDTIVDYTERLAKALHVKGMINIQFILYQGEVYVIEVNPRSSRTVPYISKITGVPVINLATKVIFGEKLNDFSYGTGLYKQSDYVAIKMPVFSFEKLRGAETSLGPEMKSTGEVLGISKNYEEALSKAFIGAGVKMFRMKTLVATVKDADKEEFLPIAKRFADQGFKIYATDGTCKFLNENGVTAKIVKRITEYSPNILDMVSAGEVDLIINTPTQGRENRRDGFLIRRNAVEMGIPCLTSLDTASALITAIISMGEGSLSLVDVTKI